jgi:hypothetical protein
MEVLEEYGFDDAAIAQLRKDGALETDQQDPP